MTLQRKVDRANVSIVESFALKPRFDIFPAGEREYNIYDWDNLGLMKDPAMPLNCIDVMEEDDLYQHQNTEDMVLDNQDSPGLVRKVLRYQLPIASAPVVSLLFVATRDFNKEEEEPAIGRVD